MRHTSGPAHHRLVGGCSEHCFDPACQQRGGVIDLWASVKAMSLRQAALDLVRTFNLEPTPAAEQRRGHG